MTDHAGTATIPSVSTFSGTAYAASATLALALVAHFSQRGLGTIYPVRLPQNPVYPCYTFQVITEPRTHTMEGRAAPNPLVQIDCWAKTYIQVHSLASAVERELDGYVGRLGGMLKVTGCLQKERQDFYEPDVDDYRVSLDYSIWHN